MVHIKRCIFLPWIALSWASSFQSRRLDSNRNEMLPNFSDSTLHSGQKQNSKSSQNIQTESQSAAVWLCLTCQRQQCLPQRRPALPSPSSETLCKAYQPAHSFVKQTHPLFMTGGLLLTHPLPSPTATPHSPNMGAGKLSSPVTLQSPASPTPRTPHLPAFTHLLGRSVSAQHLTPLIFSFSICTRRIKWSMYQTIRIWSFARTKCLFVWS